MATTYKSNSNNYFFRLIGLILCFGTALSVIIVALNLIGMGFDLKSKVFLIALLVDAGLVAIPFYLIYTKKINYNRILRFGSIIIAGCMLFLNIFASSALDLTAAFLNEQYYGGAGSIEYHIIAQRTAGVELSEKTSIRAGIQSTDNYKTEAEEKTQQLVIASFSEFGNFSDLVEATESDAVDIAVVQKVMLDAYAEYFPEAYENLEVLASFKAGSDEFSANAADAKVDITEPFVVYISGADVFGDIDQVSRSDANMLVLVDPEHYKILLINTPRDYYVQVHDTAGYKDKLTHSGLYGIDVSEQTLEDLYGINIDYHIRINFDTVVSLVDSMGGIIVNNPQTFTLWKQTYEAGEIWLNGDMAVLFSRARYSLDQGDNDRGENQQRVIEGIADRITSPDVVVNYAKVLEAMSGTFRSNIPPKVIAQLFSRQISLGGHWSFEKMSAKGTNAQRPTYSMGEKELSVIIPDETSIAEIRTAIDGFMNRSNTTTPSETPSP